jgi:hypothetical protein
MDELSHVEHFFEENWNRDGSASRITGSEYLVPNSSIRRISEYTRGTKTGGVMLVLPTKGTGQTIITIRDANALNVTCKAKDVI